MAQNDIAYPKYIEEEKCWAVSMPYGIEKGPIDYILSEMCMAGLIYHYRCGDSGEYLENDHTFEDVLIALVDNPKTFSIGEFKGEYSLQQRRFIKNAQKTLIERLDMTPVKIQTPTCEELFRKGDVVCIKNTNKIGIIISVDEEDIAVKVYYDGDAYFGKPVIENYKSDSVVLAEKDDYRTGYLEYISPRISYKRIRRRHKSRFKAVFKQIEKAWERYPDLRLGQLLLFCCRTKDALIVLEDEELMQMIQEFLEESDKRLMK